MNLSNMNSRGMQPYSFLGFARCAGWLCAALAFSVINGCASIQETPQDTVRKLANQRWHYIVDGKFDKAYDMTVPSFRKLKTKENYTLSMMSANAKWQSGEVVKVECETLTCKVTVKAVSQIALPTRFKGPLVSAQDESWIFEDGQWWKLESL